MKKSKISQIITYSILAVLVVGIILCAIIPISFKPQLAEFKFGQDIISLSHKEQTNAFGDVDSEEEYKQFKQHFDDSFKLTIMYSLFSGKIGNAQKGDSNPTTETKNGKKVSPQFDGYTVVISYHSINAQNIKLNGKDVASASNNSAPRTFNTVTFSVQEGRGLAETDLYFYTNGKEDYYKITTLANFDNLYNFINGLDTFN